MSPSPGSDPCAAAAVIIPTYNEADNIVRLLEALRKVSPALRLIVVDDGSPDGTARAARELVPGLGPLQVVDRGGKGGRGSAVLEGFRAALRDPAVEAVAEMDADFSHDPAELADTLRVLGRGGQGPDVVVRSRYHPQSRIVNWGMGRRVFSKLSNIFARVLLRMTLRDLTNGYRAYTRRAAESVASLALVSSGYIVLSETAVQLHRRGFRFAELPTVFVNRVRGQSNLSLREVKAALTGVLKVWWRYRA